MRGAHGHAHRYDTPLAQPDELLPDEANELTVEVSPEDADALFRPDPHDELDAARGVLLSCVIGACLWLLVAMLAVAVL